MDQRIIKNGIMSANFFGREQMGEGRIHFHPKTVSSRDTFIPKRFHPKTVCSNTFIQKQFHPMTLVVQNLFHPMTPSSKINFIRRLGGTQKGEGPKVEWDPQILGLKGSREGRGRERGGVGAKRVGARRVGARSVVHQTMDEESKLTHVSPYAPQNSKEWDHQHQDLLVFQQRQGQGPGRATSQNEAPSPHLSVASAGTNGPSPSGSKEAVVDHISDVSLAQEPFFF